MTFATPISATAIWTHADLPRLQALHATMLRTSTSIPLDDPDLGAVFAEVERLERLLGQLTFGYPAVNELGIAD